MNQQNFTPSKKYLYKMFLGFTLIAMVIFFGPALFVAFPVSMDKPGAGAVILAIAAIGAFLFWAVAMLLTTPYYNSMKYELHDDEVIVNIGILTHSVKHVPYRTVTNISIKRDILDRWIFNMGTLEIQTAGISGQNVAEEKLYGLEDVQGVYEMVAAELRRYRGGMTPTVAEMDVTPSESAQGVSAELLDEVRQIRQLLEGKG